MRTLDLFVVEVDKPLNDTITLDSGLELFVDTKYNEFEHRTTEGKVVAAPSKYDTGVSIGDTLYFHHLVVIQGGQPLTGVDNHYTVKCDPKFTISNQAIAFMGKETGDITPLFGWSLLESTEEEVEPDSEIIEVVKLEEEPVLKGRVSFDTPQQKELGVKKGDVVGFAKNMDYRIEIEGKEDYRVRSEDLLYVET